MLFLFILPFYDILRDMCDLTQKYSQEAVSNHEVIILHNSEH